MSKTRGLRLSPSQDGLTAPEKSAEGVVGCAVGKAREALECRKTQQQIGQAGNGSPKARTDDRLPSVQLVNVMRQNPQVQEAQQLELALAITPASEANRTMARGAEALTAEGAAEGSAMRVDHQGIDLMQEVCQPENLREALKRVQANQGSPGIDGMTVQDLPAHLKAHWPTIKQHLLRGTYKPAPVKRVEIPKPDGGMRKLGIPTVLDRFIQQAMLQVLQPLYEPTFSAHSYGFRPGRSAHQAVAKAQEHIAAGYAWVVDIDLEKFFDRVNHDRLMGRLAKRITDRRVLKIIRAFLNAGVMENGLVSATDEGTPQGGPLSPLLSNIVLDDLDRELEKRGHRFVRYADDCNIYVRSERAGQRVMKGLSDFISRKLKLQVNQSKSAVDRPARRKFLGFSFTSGPQPKRRIAPKALDRCKQKLRELTRRTRGVSEAQMINQTARYLRGWLAYFGFCQTPSVLRDLDSWVRRRLRAAAWKRWKRGRTRFAELRRRGVPHELAACSAGSSHGPTRLSRSPALTMALPNRYLESLGLPRLVPHFS